MISANPLFFLIFFYLDYFSEVEAAPTVARALGEAVQFKQPINGIKGAVVGEENGVVEAAARSGERVRIRLSESPSNFNGELQLARKISKDNKSSEQANAATREAEGTGGTRVYKKASVAGKTYLIVMGENSGAFAKEPRNWKEARAACQRLSGDLAELHKYKDFDLLESILQGEPNIALFWVGGYLNGTGPNFKENFIWNSGEPIPFKFQYWINYAPDYKKNDCLALSHYANGITRRNGEKGKTTLDTYPCGTPFSYRDSGYICEV